MLTNKGRGKEDGEALGRHQLATRPLGNGQVLRLCRARRTDGTGPGSSAFRPEGGEDHAASQRLAVSAVACFNPLTRTEVAGPRPNQIPTERWVLTQTDRHESTCSTRRPVRRDPPTVLPGALRQSPPQCGAPSVWWASSAAPPGPPNPDGPWLVGSAGTGRSACSGVVAMPGPRLM